MQRLKTRPQFQATLSAGTIARTPHFALHRMVLLPDAGDMVAPAPFPAKIARTLIGRLIAGVSSWQRKRQGRFALRELSDDLLDDIGVTRDEALREAAKSRLFSWPPRPL